MELEPHDKLISTYRISNNFSTCLAPSKPYPWIFPLDDWKATPVMLSPVSHFHPRWLVPGFTKSSVLENHQTVKLGSCHFFQVAIHFANCKSHWKICSISVSISVYHHFNSTISIAPLSYSSHANKWYGDGSKPFFTIWLWINTYTYHFTGMNIHLPAILMFTRGIGFWPIPIFGGININQLTDYLGIV